MRAITLMAVLATGAALSAMAAPSFAQVPAPPSPEDVPVPQAVAVGLAGAEAPDLVRYLMVRGAGSAQLSPDGRTLAYLSNVTGEPQIWTVPAAGGAPTQLTFGSTVNSVDWTPDGSTLLYSADTAGDEQQGYYLLSPDGLHERVLIPKADAYRVFGGFSSDGARFVYSSTERNGRDFDIYVGDTATGQTRLVHEGSFGVFVAAWQPGGDLVVMSETRGEDGADLSLLNLATGEVRSIIRPDTPSANEDVVFAPDGRSFYLITNVDRDFRAVGRYDLETSRLEVVEQADHELEQLTVSKDGRYMAWSSNEDGYGTLHVRDLTTGQMLTNPQLPRGVVGLSFAEAAPVAIVNVGAADAVAEPRIWSLETGAVTVPVRTNWAGLDPATMVRPEVVRFAGRDGTPLSGLMYLPRPAADGAKPPLVLLLHGGPSSQARPGWSGPTQYLVARGMAVLDFNYRGSTGFGKAFAMLNDQRLRPNELGDLEDAVTHVRQAGLVDPDRAAVMGGSYGGYLTNAAVGAFPDLFDAGVSIVGVMDWVSALEGASPALKASDRVEYGDIDDPDDRAFFASISPINNIDRIRTPLVVAHGANDPRDPVTESDMLVRGVRANGVEAAYLRFADEGHGVSKVANQVHMWDAIGDFLTRRFGLSD